MFITVVGVIIGDSVAPSERLGGYMLFFGRRQHIRNSCANSIPSSIQILPSQPLRLGTTMRSIKQIIAPTPNAIKALLLARS